MADAPLPTGWLHDPEEVEAVLSTMPRPLFAEAAPEIEGSGENKTTLLYKAWKDVIGHYFPYPAQQIGCCVGRGFSEGVDLLECVEIAVGKEAEVFTPTSHEAVYGMARVDVGGQRGSYEDGAVGAWAAKAVTLIGTVAQDVVGPYSDRLARLWGAAGVPDAVRQQAAQHKVKTSSLVRTYAELEDALANGYPVTVCSDQGFTLQRDAQGFCRPEGQWMHCMLFAGVRTDRPGALIIQSWGMNVPSGPLDLDQPPNSFFADREVVEHMLSMGDSWALSRFDGYKRQDLPNHWSWAGFS
jgi:hypothetical protein